MKQHITEKQYTSLSKKAQQALEEWTIEKGYAMTGDLYGYQFEPDDDGKRWAAYPCLSIGQLIEFLTDKKQDIHIERFHGGKKHYFWSLATCYDEKWKFEGKDHKELCDILWEAVKKELGK